MLIYSLLFHLYSLLAVIGGLMVITSRNPVHSVLWLIATFFSVAGLFVLLGAEFIAMVLVIVYVGAVAILFLFVVMMLNINYEQAKHHFQKNSYLWILVAILLFIDLFLVINSSIISSINKIELMNNEVTNTHYIGSLLYTKYFIQFQIAGIILLLAMIGSITLTLKENKISKKQNPTKQLNRTKNKAVKLVKVKSGEGIDA